MKRAARAVAFATTLLFAAWVLAQAPQRSPAPPAAPGAPPALPAPPPTNAAPATPSATVPPASVPPVNPPATTTPPDTDAPPAQNLPSGPNGGTVPPAAAAGPVSATAETIYAAARPRLLQIRTLVQTAGGQSTIGSGFLVTADGFALTNYHVVSQYALEPTTYRLEYAAPDGSRGPLKLHAIDVANDLAVVQLDRAGLPFFEFDERAVKGELPKGERLYAMGNPLDLGFTIVEGTYNGLVDRSYSERMHLSGALNPGMSGGPAVTGAVKVAGVNVAKQVGGELVSFLVPARHAAALLERARTSGPLTPEQARSELTRQLVAWQAALYAALANKGFRLVTLGPYRAPESAVDWFSCWSRTNADPNVNPRALVNQTNCSTQNALFVSDDLQTGEIEIVHSYARSLDLNAFQFANFISEQYRSSGLGRGSRKRQTPQKCDEDFVSTGAAASRPLLRVVWCARAYREFEGLYDVAVTSVTQDRDREALVSRLTMNGTSWPNAVAMARRFLDSVEWAP
ncbi:MAG TPA: serine protease [Casimicrobiaceae bacterium]|nr:serine protease [Casimicrobiaceae bacterium]